MKMHTSMVAVLFLVALLVAPVQAAGEQQPQRKTREECRSNFNVTYCSNVFEEKETDFDAHQAKDACFRLSFPLCLQQQAHSSPSSPREDNNSKLLRRSRGVHVPHFGCADKCDEEYCRGTNDDKAEEEACFSLCHQACWYKSLGGAKEQTVDEEATSPTRQRKVFQKQDDYTTAEAISSTRSHHQQQAFDLEQLDLEQQQSSWLPSGGPDDLGEENSTSPAKPDGPKRVLFKNVRVFDGKTDMLSDQQDVLVVDNLISKIGPDLSEEGDDEGVTTTTTVVVIDGEGRTLMPGLIDGHAHVMINDDYGTIETNMDITDIAYRATLVCKRYLMDGFTTVRDMGGPTFGLQRNINAGIIMGPRIYPSGNFISQTSGHGDFRERGDVCFSQHNCGDDSNFERFGIGTVADGVTEVLRATRINLRNGASQIKLMAGGGGSSRFDPIDTTQYSVEEITAIVEAAKDWGTYVAAHVFNDRSVSRLLDAGVMSYEHSFFISDEVMERMAAAGVFVVPQMWGISPELAKNPLLPPEKIPELTALGQDYATFGKRLLEKGVKVVFQSDYVGAFADAERARRYEIWFRTQAFDSNFEVLKQMTSTAGELLALSGPRNPFKDGPLGVVEEGAYADIILVDGNPLEDITVIGGRDTWFGADPEWKPIETMRLVMKDGTIYRNTL